MQTKAEARRENLQSLQCKLEQKPSTMVNKLCCDCFVYEYYVPKLLHNGAAWPHKMELIDVMSRQHGGGGWRSRWMYIYIYIYIYVAICICIHTCLFIFRNADFDWEWIDPSCEWVDQDRLLIFLSSQPNQYSILNCGLRLSYLSTVF